MKIPYKWLLFGPLLLFILGYLSNAIVIAANHGQMPVEGPIECVFHAAEARNDYLHSCMDEKSRLKFLGDWFWAPPDLGMASPGDFLELTYERTWFPCLAVWGALMIVGAKKEEKCRLDSSVTKKSISRRSTLYAKQTRWYR